VIHFGISNAFRLCSHALRSADHLHIDDFSRVALITMAIIESAEDVRIVTPLVCHIQSLDGSARESYQCFG
jgi:hypothetical protein